LFYTLDDPYIHLALAENIARGHYGINLSEPSSPSSSILFPFLLAAFVPAGLDEHAPLLVNSLAVLATLPVLDRILAAHCLAGTGLARAAPAIALFLLVALNGVGVAFTGMEHSLHILVGLVVLLGLLELAARDRVPDYLVACAILLPLIRFEGLAVTGAALLVLLERRRFREAAIVVAALAAALALYAGAMAALGLPVLPSAVFVKLAPAETALPDRPVLSFAVATIVNVIQGVGTRSFIVLLLLFALLAYSYSYRAGAPASAERSLAAFGMLIVLAHLLFGKFGWYARYELYLLFLVVPIVIRLYREALVRLFGADRKRRLAVAAVAATALVLHLGPRVLATAPLAARNIAAQQYQMHRFVTGCWRRPVAVNDLGWVAYRNDAHVLDLWGLGSERARRARMARAPGWMAGLVAERDVGLAMIYEDWFEGRIPAAWRKLATLRLTGPRISASRDAVAFFATREDAVAPLGACLDRFKDTLPSGAILELEPPARPRP
ncbi:MAG TPA: hypothetical protein VGC93_06280, partial [Thermoanaerobaculia bacterium]